MCLQRIKKQISDCLDQCNKLIENDHFDFVDHCDYLEIYDIDHNTLPKNNLNILQLNITGLTNKQNKLQAIINKLETSSNLHCLILCETWLTKDTKKLLSFDNHTFIGERTL